MRDLLIRSMNSEDNSDLHTVSLKDTRVDRREGRRTNCENKNQIYDWRLMGEKATRVNYYYFSFLVEMGLG